MHLTGRIPLLVNLVFRRVFGIFLALSMNAVSFFGGLGLPFLAVAEQKTNKNDLHILERSPFHFKLPLFSLDEKNLEMVSFSELVANENLIIYFFSTDSPVCRLQNRFVNVLVDWAQKNEDINLKILAINVDQAGRKALAEEIELQGKDSYKFPIALDPNGGVTDKGYGVKMKGVPLFYFFAKGGLPLNIIEGFTRDLVSIAEKTFPRGRA